MFSHATAGGWWPEHPDVRAIQAAESRVSLGNHVLLVERRDDGGVLKLMGADGHMPLEVVVTRDGALLRLGRGLAVSVDVGSRSKLLGGGDFGPRKAGAWNGLTKGAGMA